MEKHFVTFSSPGTFVAEKSTKPIDSWDTDRAVEMAKEIKERYGATPYAFHFTTRAREGEEFDSKEVKRSHQYFLGGKVETLEEVISRKDSKDSVLISNMKINNYDRIITTTEGWSWSQPLGPEDVVLEV